MNETDHAASTLRFGVFEVSLRSGELRKSGMRIKIQELPFKVLIALLEHPGEVVSREELRRRIWPNESFGDFDHAVNVAVGKLRAALGDSADTPRVIETLHRRGYRFIAPVTTNGSPGLPGTTTLRDAKAGQQNRLTVLAVTSVFVLVALALGIYHRSSQPALPNVLTMKLTRLTDNGAATSVAISPDGRYVVYASKNGEKQGLKIRQVSTTNDVELLPPAAVDFRRGGLAFSPDGSYVYFVRSDENNIFFKNPYMIPVLGGPARLLIKDVDCPPTFSPDGRQFAFERSVPARNATDILIANADGSDEHVVASIADTNPSYNPGTAWSPDGRTIAVPVHHAGRHVCWALYAISIEEGRSRELYSTTRGLIGRPTWLTGGENLLVPLGEPMSPKFQLWNISYPEGRATRVTNDLTNYDFRIDLTQDRKTMAVVARTWLSNIWVAPAYQLSAARQITFGETGLFDPRESADGKIVAGDLDHRLWILNADGSQRQSFLEKYFPLWFEPCGNRAIFLSWDNQVSLMRVDADGLNPTALFRGDVWNATCSPDGSLVYYYNFAAPEKIWRVATAGGTPDAISDIAGEGGLSRISVSPDGKFLTYIYGTVRPMAWNLAVVPAEGGLRCVTTLCQAELQGRGGHQRQGIAVSCHARWSDEYLGATSGRRKTDAVDQLFFRRDI